MAGQIRTTPEELRNRSNEYRQKAEEIGNVIAGLDNLISRLQDEFEGQAAQAFQQQYQDIRPHFVKGQEMTESLSRQTEQMARNFEDLDRQMAAGIRS
ncbi:MAG: WXG100 family type VII secretion target [Lachnospiraceae bacterium]|jgi:WXG100 family type VII secretion target|nr:WXG100 family type VII secretion target [Lachnospiraceae bacterium]